MFLGKNSHHNDGPFSYICCKISTTLINYFSLGGKHLIDFKVIIENTKETSQKVSENEKQR